ncbi:hypothetical protein BVC80_1543g1 [Macleaya cordata]|uniref:DUF7804 domain-containing protein n=1 Tax=Macleaya cordata TaxID=56857 RepID=A0A200R1H3_MACCD|nr:hypothetical protein BVC80_1543g1 [Macleaya cordata]
MAASSLGVRCGKTFSFLNAEETQTRLGRRTTEAPPCGVGLYHHHHQLNPNPNNNKPNPKQQTTKRQIIIARACLISNNLDYNCRAAVINSSSVSPLDPIFGTELEICSSSNKREKQQQQRANAKRENMVGVGGEQQQQPPISSSISAEKLDEWINYSVSEIVRNIGEAPLLVHVYSKNKEEEGSVGSPPTTIPIPLIESRKAEPGSWAGIRRSWEEGSPIPDGIILVEQLKVNNNDDEDDNANCSSSSSSTKTWGVVIQGRGADSASSCYILKTCRVWSSFGFCTHFCLVRAKCFGEIADLQLKNSWLLN